MFREKKVHFGALFFVHSRVLGVKSSIFAAFEPQRMPPPYTHSLDDPFESLRRDRDRWAQLAMDQAEYIRQLEQQVINLKTLLEMKDKNQQPSAPVINVAGDYIANQHNEYHTDIHDNTNCPIYLTPNDEAYSQPLPKRRGDTDQRTKRLFMTDGIEDMQRTEEEKNRFRNYLTDHHLGQRQLDCSADNPIHKAIVCFCVKWKRLKYIDKPSPAAVLRFLTETCGISCASEPSALCTLLGRMFKNEYDKEVFFDVEDYF